jgi:hypothetical protein
VVTIEPLCRQYVQVDVGVVEPELEATTGPIDHGAGYFGPF